MRGKKKPGKPSDQKKAAKGKNNRSASGSIRIIAGKWRGRKLPVADSEGLRPTTDRTKETVFNWLMQDVVGANCLDLFAGSGSLGLEALSRHASKAVFVEKHASIARNLMAIQNTLHLSPDVMQVINAEALTWLAGLKANEKNSDCKNDHEKFDLVFIDPPFHKNLVKPAVTQLIHNQVLKRNTLIYVEHETELDWSVPDNLVQIKQKHTQQVASRLFEFCPD
jgi:16S rRNA (guanine966-N2)-methyltransferase